MRFVDLAEFMLLWLMRLLILNQFISSLGIYILV